MKLKYIENNRIQETIDLTNGLKIKTLDEKALTKILTLYGDIGNRISLTRGNSVGKKLSYNKNILEVKHYTKDNMYMLEININKNNVLTVSNENTIKINSINLNIKDVLNKLINI